MNKILFKLIEGKGKFFLNGDLVNGEIVNPEVIHIDWGLTKAGSGGLNNGQIFDFPEGMGFEEETEWADIPREIVRLLPDKPVQEEESQDALWASIINEARWYDGSPQDLVNFTSYFKSKFGTIKRKES